MKTITTTRIKTNTEGAAFFYWEEGSDDPVEIEFPMSAEDQKEIADDLKCSPVLINAMSTTLHLLIELISEDLAEIWERLDRLEA